VRDFFVCTGALICDAAGLLKGTPGNDELGVISPAQLGASVPAAQAENDLIGASRFGANRGRIGAPANSGALK
jgi:hypothetical protein